MKMILFLLILSFNSTAKLGVHKLSSLDISNNKELRTLYKLIKNAQVVGIGESGHASAGFLKARTKIIKGLVEDKGYRLILLEQGYVKTNQINNYLQLCHSGAQTDEEFQKTLRSLDDIYSNQSTKELVLWLCGFNKKAKEPVRFHGMDQWEVPWVNRDIIKQGIELTESEEFSRVYDLAEKNCFAWQINDWGDGPELASWRYILDTWRLQTEEHRLCIGSLYNLKRIMSSYQSSDNEVVFSIKMALKVSYVYQMYRDLYITDITRALNMRDDLQAYLVTKWMSKYNHNLKSIVLAHNIHISKNQSKIIPPYPGGQFRWVGVRSTGENLVGHYGDKYKSIALSGYEVSSSRDGDYPVLDDKSALDYKLAKYGDYLIVNPKTKWISKKKWWLHNENQPMFFNPSKQYDAIFFVKKSSKAQRLLFRD